MESEESSAGVLQCPYCPETFDVRGERYDHCLRNHREEMDTWVADRSEVDGYD